MGPHPFLPGISCTPSLCESRPGVTQRSSYLRRATCFASTDSARSVPRALARRRHCNHSGLCHCRASWSALTESHSGDTAPHRWRKEETLRECPRRFEPVRQEHPLVPAPGGRGANPPWTLHSHSVLLIQSASEVHEESAQRGDATSQPPRRLLLAHPCCHPRRSVTSMQQRNDAHHFLRPRPGRPPRPDDDTALRVRNAIPPSRSSGCGTKRRTRRSRLSVVAAVD